MQRDFDFYIVPTPIGNIKDITLRALDVLKSVDLIACEDTRTTQKLLNHYNIRTKCISCHKYNEKERISFFLNELAQGKKIALVSDAGTPMICDPGGVIVSELIKNDYTITSLPGACTIPTFLSRIPRHGEDFAFIGFIPRTETQIQEIMTQHAAQNIVFYDSPARIIKTLEIINKYRPNVKVALGRELSKLFEEVIVGSVGDITQHFNEEIKGEIVCMIYADENIENYDMTDKIHSLKAKNFSNKDIAVILSTLYNCNKNDIYKQTLLQ